MIQNLEEKLKKEYEMKAEEQQEAFIEEARKAVSRIFKDMGINHGEVLCHDNYRDTISISRVAVFQVEDLKIAVRQDTYGTDHSQTAFLVVFKCKTCGVEDWAPFENLESLGFALSQGHRPCIPSIAERIAGDGFIFYSDEEYQEHEKVGC